MNPKEIASFVLRYLEATNCQIIEKTPGSVTVRLSPEADKALTGRSYYWSFVERTGAPPETMTMRFVFDPKEQEQPGQPGTAGGQPQQPNAPGAGASGDSILARYFGITPVQSAIRPGGVRSELVHFGSRRLEQLFDIVRRQGRFVQMYEAEQEVRPRQARTSSAESRAYSSWLAVNYKVEYICDMKRDELHALGISLSTGEIVDRFYDRLTDRKLSPKLPANCHLRPAISLERALEFLEREVERRVRQTDHGWAREAQERLAMELGRVDDFYSSLMRSAPDEEAKKDLEARHEARRREIEWQYRPRVAASVINCGIFHLWDDTFSPI